MIQQYLLFTPVASLIFALTIATSIYTFSNPSLYGKFMLYPYAIARKQQLFTVFTSGLIHKDWGHLLFNMMTFFYFGFGLERLLAELSSWGHLQFAVIYLLSLVLSDIPTIIRHKNNKSYASLGASGAICAVLFSYILFDPKMMLGIFMVIPMPAWLFGILFIGYSVWASKRSSDGINHDAHLFGAIAGMLLTLLLYPWILTHFIGQFI